MAHVHYINVCEFGRIHRQCRCEDATLQGREVRHVECDQLEKHTPDTDMPKTEILP